MLFQCKPIWWSESLFCTGVPRLPPSNVVKGARARTQFLMTLRISTLTRFHSFFNKQNLELRRLLSSSRIDDDFVEE